MTTIYDIAKKTGFSITTVSKVLNNYSDVGAKTRKKILDAVNEMDYYPSSSARSLTTKKSWSIGVVYVEQLGMEHPFFNAVIESFKNSMEKSGYDLLFASNKIGNDMKTYLDHFQYRGVDGVVIVCSALKDSHVERLIRSTIPSVVIDFDSRETCVVYSDNEYGCELAVNHLYSLGHRKIAHISGDQELFPGVTRLEGFIRAMQKHKLSISDGFIADGGYFSYEGGRAAMRKLLLQDEKPTAVFVAGDLMALGAIAEIRDHGLNVPDDISVIGFDDIKMIQYTEPALTTIRQETSILGKTAANLLLDQINDKEKQSLAVKIPVKLIERKSCRPI
ncbi:LacI family DNA-binding transcriptional regulator [Evansella tamaricis]|uniref:LacI family transcriptional regulator n=1 Tax=Evansella tamaricis TaxID=2069301 RepID=A0ABS6JGW9_9BACI|nr:LacI family DNA-binding transcriptional regulator [Evansella tamaricis]MBU9712887.1 LacI family transcriptional regulator [Evansella tamaricis]